MLELLAESSPISIEAWQAVLLATIPPILVAFFNWILNRRAEQAKEKVSNDATVVTTVTDAMEALSEELARVRNDLKAAEQHARHVTSLLESIAAAMDKHRSWDEERVQEGSSPPPPLPSVPHWWEMRWDLYENNGQKPE